MLELIKKPTYKVSKDLPYYIITCPNCNKTHKLSTVYIGGTYECLDCSYQFVLVKGNVVVVP